MLLLQPCTGRGEKSELGGFRQVFRVMMKTQMCWERRRSRGQKRLSKDIWIVERLRMDICYVGLSRKFEIEKMQNQDERKFMYTIWPSNSGEWTDLPGDGLHCYTRFEPIRYPSFTLLSSSRDSMPQVRKPSYFSFVIQLLRLSSGYAFTRASKQIIPFLLTVAKV